MAVDGITLGLLTDELASAVTGCRIDKIFQPDKHTVILHLRGYSGIKKLLISILPSDPHINLSENVRDNPQMPPSFCMLLRKYIAGSKIVSVTNPGYERLIEFTLSNTDELHDSRTFKLIVELMGRFANIILVNESGKILDSAVHVDFQVSRVREVMPARIYEYPQTQNKLLPSECLAMLAEGELPVLPEESGRPVTKALLNSVRGMSPNLARGICINCDIDERACIRDIDSDSLGRLINELTRFFRSITGHTFKAYLYSDVNGDAQEFSILKYPGYPQIREFDSLSDCIEQYYSVKEKNINLDMRRHRLLQIVNNALSRLMRKYEIHRSDYEDAGQSDKYKLYGDLLLSYGYMAKPKDTSITCLNYYSEPQEEITIPLDPSLSASANAQDYYKRWRKAKRKMEVSEGYIKEDELAISYLRSLKNAVSSASSAEDIMACEEEVNSELMRDTGKKREVRPSSGDPNKMVGRAKSGKAASRALRNAAKIAQAKKNGTTRSKDKHRSEESLSYRRFTTSDGYTCLSGRNNIQNDQLTFGIADKNDWWFHIKDLPGTHVILRAKPGEEMPSDTAVIEAAQAAAYYSRSTILEEHSNTVSDESGSLKVEIDYCPVSHVKKIPHSKPGMVIYEQHYSIIVDAVKPEERN